MSWTGIGVVTVTTPGTKVPLSATDIRCNEIRVQALASSTHTNTGKIYLYDRNGVRLATMGAPVAANIPMISWSISVAPGGLNVRDYTIDAETGTDGVDVSYLRP